MKSGLLDSDGEQARHRPAGPAVRGAAHRHARRPDRRHHAPAAAPACGIDAAARRARARRSRRSCRRRRAAARRARATRSATPERLRPASTRDGAPHARGARPPASRPPSCSARPAMRPAGARARSATPTAATRYNLFGIKAGAGLDRQDRRRHDHRIRRRRAAQGDGQVPRLRLLRGVVPRLRPADQRAARATRRRCAQTGSRRRPTPASLQRAGYATDPAYAAKLSRAINTSAAAAAQRMSLTHASELDAGR